MQAALDRHLKEKGCSFSIIKDREFFNSRKVLEGKARKLRNEGKGKLPNRSRSLTREEEALWESGQLGNSSSRSLLNTMWWLLSQHFGLHGCHEHHTINVEDFTLNRDNNGNDFVTFAEARQKHGKEVYEFSRGLYNPKCSQLVNHDVPWLFSRTTCPRGLKV